MNAVRGIDLQALAACAVVDDLVDVRRAEALARVAELLRAALDTHVRIEDLQVGRLGLIVCRRGEKYRREAVAWRQRAIHPLTVHFGVVGQKFQTRVIRRPALQGPRRTAAGDDFERRVGHAEPEALLEARFEVTDRLELLSARRGAPAGIEAIRGAHFRQVFRGQHAGADRLVNAFYLRDVDAAAGVAEEHRAGHIQARNRLPATRRDGPGTRCDNFATLQEGLHARVMFELLKRLER